MQVCNSFNFNWMRVCSAFSALRMLLGWQEGHLACRRILCQQTLQLCLGRPFFFGNCPYLEWYQKDGPVPADPSLPGKWPLNGDDDEFLFAARTWCTNLPFGQVRSTDQEELRSAAATCPAAQWFTGRSRQWSDSVCCHSRRSLFWIVVSGAARWCLHKGLLCFGPEISQTGKVFLDIYEGSSVWHNWCWWFQQQQAAWTAASINNRIQ